MSDFDLPRLDAGAHPEFVDAASCKRWLQDLPMVNVAQSQHQLQLQLKEFNRFPVAAAKRLATIEAVREAVHFVQIEQAKRFSNRALPMAEAEASVFDRTIALWDEIATGYLHCVEAAAGGETAMQSSAALACQRAITCLGLAMFHFHRAYREVPAQRRRRLHRAYARAEQLKVEETGVKDYLNRDVHDTSPRIAYLRAILMGAASPSELAQRQLTFVAFLLERWASKVDVGRAPVRDPRVPPLLVDLQGADGAVSMSGGAAAQGSGDTRFLNVSKLAMSLRNRILLLRKGESPARLGLGEDCVQPSCEQLLVLLYNRWCRPKPPQTEEPRLASDPLHVCSDLAAIHFNVSGGAFRPPGGAAKRELTSREREELETFGRVVSRDADARAGEKDAQREDWVLESLGTHELRMSRRGAGLGRRYTHGQLVGISASSGRGLMLGQLRWLMCTESGELQAAVKLLHGQCVAMAVRATGLGAGSGEYVPALSLTAVHALNVPPSLILPSGWYKPQRILEVHIESAAQVRLTEVIERGSDFERVVYEVV
ncbi:MAG: hypothetical protein OEW21_08200 [Betaproteobacteria bacterium]|nr:hypothetical protein [Betaproteobacteria bacterium]